MKCVLVQKHKTKQKQEEKRQERSPGASNNVEGIAILWALLSIMAMSRIRQLQRNKRIYENGAVLMARWTIKFFMSIATNTVRSLQL